ncbi:major facilitator superfamily domain-containing protein [Penicillium lagena]|uniref:major facilitator superfamily domain-containing protein n=1 Tax=Penicillium lagena TaxID=94218 RepID=UPI00253FA5B1|nr:major facilitator superfamily domain-containing protein [Penicillium lagena]KAJ5611177.1 major facilitator superfamily domain-containing protein [Penicillium lagena]
MSSTKTPGYPDLPDQEKSLPETKHLEQVSSAPEINLSYEEDEEPEFHARTWFALAAMFLLNLVQVFGLLGPPTVLSFIKQDLHNTSSGTWVPNSLSLVQAVLAPLVSSLSDTFQARKHILVGASVISFIGAAIAPGSEDIYRLIAAQVLIGFGFSTVPLAYCVPSEILPRKWRPMAQAAMNVAAAIGACSSPLIIGSLTRANAHTGWRYFYWIQMGLWGATAIGLFIGYRPPKRHTQLDHLSFGAKLLRLDLPGFFLLTVGLTLLLTGLNLGGGLYAWAAAPVLVTLIIGITTLLAFGIYEWKFVTTGILHHDLFRGGKNRGRTFGLCIGLMFIEGIIFFSFVIFYPVLISTLFENDPFLLAVRQLPWWIAGTFGTVTFGYFSTKFKTIRMPLFAGFILLTGGTIGFTTIQPTDGLNTWFFAALAGFGFGAPLILIIVGVQLSTPHHLIATATAATTCSRAVAGSMFTAIYSAALDARLAKYIPSYVAEAAVRAGLPKSSLGPFIKAITADDSDALQSIRGVSPTIISAGITALKQAYADGLRVVYIIAAPFGLLACVACFFLGDLKDVMNYRVDAPVEDLHAKQDRGRQV